MSQANSRQSSEVPYTALLGGVIQQQRKDLDQQFGQFQQGHVAARLNMSQSAYSRIESGDTSISVTQLRQIAYLLNTNAQWILNRADFIAGQLEAQGAQITHEKKDNSAAILVGLGLLAAALLVAGSTTS